MTDGTQTATGIVRVDVSAPPDRDTTPITVPHTAFLRLQQPVDVDVLATDIDPTGGVLIVTGIIDPAEDEGVRVEVVDHRILRVTLDAAARDRVDHLRLPGEQRPRRGGGRGDGRRGTASPRSTQPPVAAPDTISARTGDVVDIGVLDNDEHPDALAAHARARPPRGARGAGSSSRPATGCATSRPRRPASSTRRTASRHPTASSRPRTCTSRCARRTPRPTRPPVPQTVTARVIAGETVRIPIPLGGADPDGDSVQLLGQESSPERGAVVSRGGDWLEYEAGEYSAGTDTFQYAVVDALGARATGSDPRRHRAAAGRRAQPRSRSRTPSPCGRGGRSRCGCSRTTPTPTAARSRCSSVEANGPERDRHGRGRHRPGRGARPTRATSASSTRSRTRPSARPRASSRCQHATTRRSHDPRRPTRCSRSATSSTRTSSTSRCCATCSWPTATPPTSTSSSSPGYDGGAQVRRDGSIRVAVEDHRRIIPF